jgi:predicted GH43/DUF377 family glycosyl hydrolase
MRWKKMGLIYGPNGKYPWAKYSALQPTPCLISDDIIRVYVGFRDANGISRVGFVDLDVNNPSKVLKVSEKPALDIGNPGTFDENGVVPCAIAKREGKLYLYYAGYQLGQKVKFYAFCGLAISEDGGDSFIRYSCVPILDRTDNELFFRVIHSIMFENDMWKAWYGGGSKFIEEKDKKLPVYDIRYFESKDGINFEKIGKLCIEVKGGDEHRVGRPYVIKDGTIYKMFYGVGTKSKGFRLGYAESKDGINWQKKNEEVGIDVSGDGWDSQMISYPSIVKYKDKVYMFYNGNNYGYDGFGYAILEEW